ncbi:MAG: hypothetical protein WKF37_19035 [Bryobacteraceae bacterium]
MILIRVSAQHQRTSTQDCDDSIETAIVVQVAECRSSPGHTRQIAEHRALKFSFGIPVQSRGLQIQQRRVDAFDIV